VELVEAADGGEPAVDRDSAAVVLRERQEEKTAVAAGRWQS